MVNMKNHSFSLQLSRMAMAETHGEDSPYFEGWRAYNRNPYDQLLNPSGIIQMGLAENQLCTDLLEEWLEKNSEILAWKGTIPSFKETALYQDYHGLANFKKALACFMEEVRGERVNIDPDRIVLTAGATAANEILTFCIANPGEALLVPTPYYPGFDRDLRWRTGVEIIPVQCHSQNNFEITLASLQQAHQEALHKNITPKAILITNPSNPLGRTLPPRTLCVILDFAASNSLHVICDEVYSATTFSMSPFVSILEIVQAHPDKYDPSSVHVVYGLSKDLGIPGFRIGVIYSENPGVIVTATRMSSFSLVSSQTQAMMTHLLADRIFRGKYLVTMRERLRRRQGALVKGLRELGIECLDGNSGLFCWVKVEVGKIARVDSSEGEMRVWKVILEEIGLNVSPGCSFHCGEPGWFRVCFGNMSEKELGVALGRIRSSMGGVANRLGLVPTACLARVVDTDTCEIAHLS